jgi:hypothetical protein
VYEKEKGKGIHRTAGGVEQGGKENNVKKHDQGEQDARDRPFLLLNKVVKGEIGAGPEQDDQDEEGKRGCNFEKDIDGQNEEELTDEGTPPQEEEPGNCEAGSGCVAIGSVDKDVGFF